MSRAKVTRFIKDFFGVEAGDRLNVPVICPWCGSVSSKKHLNIQSEKGLFYCFKCGQAGNFKKIVYELIDEDGSINPLDYLDEDEDIEVRTIKFFRTPKIGKDKLVGLPPGAIPVIGEIDLADTLYTSKSRSKEIAYSYLLNRGLTATQMRLFDVHFCNIGKYKHRVIVPVLSLSGEMVGWVARSWDKLEPVKVLTPTGSEIKKHIFGLNWVRTLAYEHIVVVEGVFDALRHGTQFVALLGKDPTKEQISKLVQLRDQFKSVTIMLDTDAEAHGVNLAKRLKILLPRTEILFATPRPAKDPGDMREEEMKKAIDEAKRL